MDDYPGDATAAKIYDDLDASRALQAYLLGLPMMNQAGMRGALRAYAKVQNTII
ncbi:hypothetical protein WBP07_20135 (plasmid) [Novosphingobium sp. BL-8A]|uniref:hypothetical protein n=1 Tax=Novosphingobium sp. BL-8A TaxID=3127639 RepID=UPI0037580696